MEECDDANDDDDDACVSTCMIAFCGDGFVQITAGQHTLKFEYDKDISLSAGADSIWVDDLQIVP